MSLFSKDIIERPCSPPPIPDFLGSMTFKGYWEEKEFPKNSIVLGTTYNLLVDPDNGHIYLIKDFI